MNLWFRLIWALLRAWRPPNIEPGAVIERRLRGWPGDLDVNGHINNGRYLTIIDAILLEYFVRSGFARVVVKAGWRPMSGGAVISNRSGLWPGQRYRLRFSLASASEVWNFVRFELLREDGTLCAAGYMKGAAEARSGLVPNRESYAHLDRAFEPAELPASVEHWCQAERTLIADMTA